MENETFYMKSPPSGASTGTSITIGRSSGIWFGDDISSSTMGYAPAHRVDMGFDENGVWEVFKQESTVSNNWGLLPDKVFKKIYEIVDGKLIHTKTIEGTIQPEQIIPETYSFEDEEA